MFIPRPVRKKSNVQDPPVFECDASIGRRCRLGARPKRDVVAVDEGIDVAMPRPFLCLQAPRRNS